MSNPNEPPVPPIPPPPEADPVVDGPLPSDPSVEIDWQTTSSLPEVSLPPVEPVEAYVPPVEPSVEFDWLSQSAIQNVPEAAPAAPPAEEPPHLPPVSAAESWGDGTLAFTPPPQPPAESSRVFDETATPWLPAARPVETGASASSLFGESVPAAEPVGDVPEAAAADSGVALGEPVEADPVSPASGWLSPADGDGIPVVPTAAAFGDGIEAELAGPLPPGAHGEGSDIFAAPKPAAPDAGQSDVIAATSWGDAPAAPARSVPHTSDVALTFDQPPGGSTIQEPADDLPIADDVADLADPDAAFEPGGDGPLDSSRLAGAPPLPGEDEPEYGAAPHAGPDASSILADLIEPARPLGDTSAVRLEAPGIDPTMSDAELPADLADATEPEAALPAGYANLWDAAAGPDSSPVAADDEDESGSDLFAGARPAGPRFELTPEDPGGKVDPFAGSFDESEEPSLSSAPSSIFTAPTAPPSGVSGGSKVPVAEADAADFSDHPDLAAAGAVDFDAIDDFGDGRTIRSPIPEDAVDLADPAKGGRPTPSSGDVLAAAAGAAGADEGLDWLAAAAPPSSGTNMARGLADGFAPEPAAPAPKPAGKKGSTASVEMDWVSGPSEAEMVVAEPSRRDRRDRSGPARAAAEPAPGVNGRAGVGLLLGMLLGVGGASGVYFSGMLDNGKGTPGPVATGPGAPLKADGTTQPAVPPAAPTVADAQAALAAGDPNRALAALTAANADTTEAKAARGQARLLVRLRELAPEAAAPADDAMLAQARADLEAVVADGDAAKSPDGRRAAVRAAVHLGLTHELAGDRAKARAVYEDGAKKFPAAADVFRAALDRLDATAPAAAGATSFRLAPADAERLLVASVLLLQGGPGGPAPVAEAGGHFWRAANLAAAGRYADAAAELDRAKAAHVAHARAAAGRGLNPLTDPLEQIFPRACDDLKAYWVLRGSLYDHPGVGPLVKSAGVPKAFDALAGYKTERDTLAADLKKSAGDLKTATDKLATAKEEGAKAEKEVSMKLAEMLKAEKEGAAKLGEDVKKAKADATEAGKLYAAAKADALEAGKKADTATKAALALGEKVKTLDGQVNDLTRDKATATAALDAIAKELQAGKLLGEKYSPADLLAASKTAVGKATAPTIANILPPGVAAVAGAGLTTGTLVDLADRATKADAAVKAAATDLAAAQKKYDADLVKAKADADAGLKTAADAHKAALKKAGDDAAAVLAKTKADAAGEVTKAKADADAAVKKSMSDRDAAVAQVEAKAKADAAKASLALTEAERRYKLAVAEGGNPAEALPLWVPVLADLRRPADAAPALAAAGRVLKTAPPTSEDAARAWTVTGLAKLLTDDAPAAKAAFDTARGSPAYAAEKDWAKAADVGLASLTDPAARSRAKLPADRRKDIGAAARALDAGITAYNAGRYADAERALADAAWHDDASPLPWYFLGASKYAAGRREDALADFRQGGEREGRREVSSRAVSEALSPIQGPARAALDAARP